MVTLMVKRGNSQHKPSRLESILGVFGASFASPDGIPALDLKGPNETLEITVFDDAATITVKSVLRDKGYTLVE